MYSVFLTRWAYTPKPYVDKRTKKVDIAFRQVQTQPLVLDAKPKEGTRNLSASLHVSRGQTKTTGPRYNLRKLTELPEHLIGAEMWNEVEEVSCFASLYSRLDDNEKDEVVIVAALAYIQQYQIWCFLICYISNT